MNDTLACAAQNIEVSTDATRRTRRGASEAAHGMCVMCCGPLLVPLPKAHWWHGEHYLANETGSIDLAIGRAISLYVLRPVASAGAEGALAPPSQFLAEQLTLSQPEGADGTHHSTTSPPDFQTLQRP